MGRGVGKKLGRPSNPLPCTALLCHGTRSVFALKTDLL